MLVGSLGEKPGYVLHLPFSCMKVVNFLDIFSHVQGWWFLSANSGGNYFFVFPVMRVERYCLLYLFTTIELVPCPTPRYLARQTFSILVTKLHISIYPGSSMIHMI